MNGKAQPIRCSPDANVSCTRHVHTTPQDHRDDGLPYGVTPQSIRRTLPFKSLQRHLLILLAGNTQHHVPCVTHMSPACSGAGATRKAHHRRQSRFLPQ